MTFLHNTLLFMSLIDQDRTRQRQLRQAQSDMISEKTGFAVSG